MEIKPEEIESVKNIGNLHGDEVKIVKTIGGFHIAIGKKESNSRKSEALAAGSHPGIVAHQIAKQYKNDFQPAICKSEDEQIEKAEEMTKLLPNKYINTGLELYILNKTDKYDFVLCKHGVDIGKYEAEIDGDQLLIKNHSWKTNVPNLDVARAFASMFDKVVRQNGLSGVK